MVMERIVAIGEIAKVAERADIAEVAELAAMAGSCLTCGKALRGRIDKKFCDAGCRNVYHNRRQRTERKEINGVDLVLKHNRRILKSCLGREQTRRVTKEELLARGFRFEFFTHQFTNRRGKRYCFTYDHGWLTLESGQYLVVKQQAGED
jgi:predicted nucleic acid-binding Zn ribbon protein